MYTYAGIPIIPIYAELWTLLGPNIGFEAVYNVWFSLYQNDCRVIYYIGLASIELKKCVNMMCIYSFYVKMRQNIDKFIFNNKYSNSQKSF